MGSALSMYSQDRWRFSEDELSEFQRELNQDWSSIIRSYLPESVYGFEEELGIGGDRTDPILDDQVLDCPF